MRGGISERSSILLIGRNTVVIGAVLITIASFGIGYFFGFRVTGSEREKPAAQSAKPSAETIAMEDRQVIDLPVKDSAGKPVSSKAAAPKQPETDTALEGDNQAQPAAEAEKQKAGNEADAASAAKMASEPNKKAKKNEKAAVAASNQAQANAPVQAAVQPARAEENADTADNAAPKSAKHPAGKTKKKAKSSVPAGKLYAVQVGAFPNKDGAEQLFQSLKAKGYSPHIIDATEANAYYKVRIGAFKNKKDAEKNAAELLKKTGLQNFITAAQ